MSDPTVPRGECPATRDEYDRQIAAILEWAEEQRAELGRELAAKLDAAAEATRPIRGPIVSQLLSREDRDSF